MEVQKNVADFEQFDAILRQLLVSRTHKSQPKCKTLMHKAAAALNNAYMINII